MGRLTGARGQTRIIGNFVEVAVSVAEKKVRFGEFELDFGGFQLYRSGRRVRLEGLPLQLLMFLVENKGQLVTREQVARELWSDGVFVDVEQGINTAIRKVRIALEDDSVEPRYLQTVVGRGYRFVGATTVEEPVSASSGGEGFTVSPEEFGRALMAAAGLDPENPKAPPKRRGES